MTRSRRARVVPRRARVSTGETREICARLRSCPSPPRGFFRREESPQIEATGSRGGRGRVVGANAHARRTLAIAAFCCSRIFSSSVRCAFFCSRRRFFSSLASLILLGLNTFASSSSSSLSSSMAFASYSSSSDWCASSKASSTPSTSTSSSSSPRPLPIVHDHTQRRRDHTSGARALPFEGVSRVSVRHEQVGRSRRFQVREPDLSSARRASTRDTALPPLRTAARAMPTQYVRFSGAADLRMRLVCATLSGRALRCVRAPAPHATAAAAAPSRISGRRPRGTRHRTVARAVCARALDDALARTR